MWAWAQNNDGPALHTPHILSAKRNMEIMTEYKIRHTNRGYLGHLFNRQHGKKIRQRFSANQVDVSLHNLSVTSDTGPQQNTPSASFEPQLTQAWHSGMSPSPYQGILLPNNVSVCYGCHSKFTEEVWSFPRYIVVRHKDRWITGRGENGDFLVSPDNIVRKNPMFFI